MPKTRTIIVNDAYRRLNPAANEAVQKGWTFEELLRVNVGRGVLTDATNREEEFIRERLEQHRRADHLDDPGVYGKPVLPDQGVAHIGRRNRPGLHRHHPIRSGSNRRCGKARNNSAL